MANHRTTMIVDRDLQLKIALLAPASIIATGLVMAVTMGFLARAGGELDTQAAALVRHLQLFVAASSALSAAGMFLLGVKMSLQIVGPLHRIKTSLTALGCEQKVAPVRLREGDELSDLGESFNAVLARSPFAAR